MTTETTTEQVSERQAPAPDDSARNSHALLTPTEVSDARTSPEIDPTFLDADAVRVLLRLKQNGHQGYLVGGCVRDSLIGRTPKDFDIATSATPNQVKSLFRNCRLIGRRFRLAHVYFKGGKILEVSTFRANPTVVDEPLPSEAAEGEVRTEGTEHIVVADREAIEAVERGEPVPEAVVEDNADDPSVSLTPNPDAPRAERDLLITEDNTFGTELEDALRRDFTINGLFYDPLAGKVIDHVSGLRDLAAEQIRTIGDAEQRMREDPVRILRAVRFAGKLGFDIESRTYAAMEGSIEDLPRCSAPRLLEETFRLIRGGGASPALKLLLALDGLKHLLPPVNDYLAEQDAEGQAAYFKSIAEMDSLVNAGTSFDDSMLLACILLPIALDEPEPETVEGAVQPVEAVVGAPDVEVPAVEGAAPVEAAVVAAAPMEAPDRPPSVAKAIEVLLSELVRAARLPRRIAERCRMILLSQKTLAGLRRRRGGLQGFRSHPLFNESLAVFEVWVRATGEHKAALDSWKVGAAPSVSTDAEGPRRRRRRRRRGGGGGDRPQA
ncbi:MAG: poly(A) polymerase [Myxococcales bacterium]|nr:poly(A) polymerase [Myxococcales bacterium]